MKLKCIKRLLVVLYKPDHFQCLVQFRFQTASVQEASVGVGEVEESLLVGAALAHIAQLARKLRSNGRGAIKKSMNGQINCYNITV